MTQAIFCTACGATLAVNSRFCCRCGAAQQQPQPNPQLPARAAWGITGYLGFGLAAGIFVLMCTVGSVSHSSSGEGYGPSTPGVPTGQSADERTSDELRKQVDPPPIVPLTPSGHLKRAKELLAEFNTDDYDKCDVLFKAISDHTTEAKKDSRLVAAATRIMNKVAAKSIEAAEKRAWTSASADFNARVVCRTELENRLKAPGTADWKGTDSHRWRGHPGGFLIDETVDAENSFGAKLRAGYECQVVCLTEDSCLVQNVSEIAR